MKKIIILGVVLLIALVLGFYWYRTARAEVGTLTIYSGSIKVLRNSTQVNGNNGLGIKVNDVLVVDPGSRAGLVLFDGSILRLEGGTQIAVASLRYKGKTLTDASFSLLVGKVWSKPKPLPQGSQFEVETPTIVAAVRGTSFNTEYLERASSIYVYRHQVSTFRITNIGDVRSVSSGQFFKISDIHATEDFNQGPRDAQPGEIDDWIRFNQKLDDEIDGVQSVQTQSTTTSASLELPVSTTSTTSSQETVVEPSKPTTNSTKEPNKTIIPGTQSVFAPPAKQPTVPLSATKQVVKISLSATNTSLAVEQSVLLKVAITFSDGSSQTSTDGVSWLQTPELGIIKNPGYFTGVKEGSTQVVATFGGVHSEAITLQIGNQKQITRLSISCQKNSPKDTATNYRFPTAQCSVQVFYSDGTSASVTNQSTLNASGSAKGTINSSGYYVPESQGSDTITAHFNGVSASTIIQIP